MLRQVAEGVLVHESEFCQRNAVVVQGHGGVLLIDAGVLGDELACLANDLSDSGGTVVAGFSTHPHWDHLLRHPGLGEAPRYGTARCAATVRDRLSNGIDPRRFGIPDEVPLDPLGLITGLSADAARIPWDGPEVRIIEHQAHGPGHAALLIGRVCRCRVLRGARIDLAPPDGSAPQARSGLVPGAAVSWCSFTPPSP